jgi:hypothetical protein
MSPRIDNRTGYASNSPDDKDFDLDEPDRPLLAYAPSVHDKITRMVPQDLFVCKKGCQDFLGEVQKRADSRFSGDKTNGRLWLHYMRPRRPYKGSARFASPKALVMTAEKRAFEVIAQMIVDSKGELSNQQTGQILYLLGTLIHAHQDKKHMEGNWTDREGDGINSLDHFFLDINQLFSDLWPSCASVERALDRTEDFLKRFQDTIRERAGSSADEALRRIGEFELEKGRKVSDYRNSVSLKGPFRKGLFRRRTSHLVGPGIEWLAVDGRYRSRESCRSSRPASVNLFHLSPSFGVLRCRLCAES